jgi:general L-amino acid transport system permease protein
MTVTAAPNRPASTKKPGAGRWIRRNLFRTPFDSLLTIGFGAISLYVVFRVFTFVFVNARWEIIRVNLKLLLVGRWPADDMAVLAVSLVVIGLWGGVIAGLIAGGQIRAGTSTIEEMTAAQRVSDLVRRFALIIATVLLLLLLTDTSGPWLTAPLIFVASLIGYWIGRVFGVRDLGTLASRIEILLLIGIPIGVFFYMTSAVPLADWEGFMFNVTSAAAGIVLSFPIGVLLALGRRSKLPLLKWVSIVYIEFVRGSPLFVLLLLANVSLEFFVPAALAPSKVVRAIVTFTIFTAAYIAEIVRGGLQSVPRGQEEAAKALGLTPAKQMFLIVLPQALRNIIPAQIGQFISLFKDTTLAGVALGILDLLNGAGAITQQADFRGQGLIIEALVFVAFLFWVGSFTMSRESQRLETKLGVGTR